MRRSAETALRLTYWGTSSPMRTRNRRFAQYDERNSHSIEPRATAAYNAGYHQTQGSPRFVKRPTVASPVMVMAIQNSFQCDKDPVPGRALEI